MCFPVPETILQKLDTIKAKLAINARVGVRIQESIQSPFVVGVLRPVIYLPLSFLSGLTSDQIELTHLRTSSLTSRGQTYLWNLIRSVTRTILFHPAVWWIGGVLRELREHSCDDCVLDSFDYPTAYAAALLALAESRTEQRSIALSFGGEGRARHLVTRAERILRHPRNRTERLEPVARRASALQHSLPCCFCLRDDRRGRSAEPRLCGIHYYRDRVAIYSKRPS